MVERIQQLASLGALFLAGFWAIICWSLGESRWTFVAAAVLLSAYSMILGAEFVLLYWAHGNDAAHAPTVSQIFKAWGGEVVFAPRIFCWQQPFQSRRWRDQVPAHVSNPRRRGVLLVHGFACNRGLWNSWMQRLHAEGTPFIAVDLEPVFGSIDDSLGIIDRAMRRLVEKTGMPAVIVAHSMGGLAVRRWWALQGEDALVHRVVTLGTPHAGTLMARFGLGRNAQQMRRSSQWLLDLVEDEPKERYRSFTCFYSNCDNIVLPSAAATLLNADNRLLPGIGHVHLVDHPEPFQETQRWL